MKCCIIFIFVVVSFHFGYSATEVKEYTEKEYTKIIEDCQKKTNASDADIMILSEYTVPVIISKEQSCLLACVWQKVGDMDSENKLTMSYTLKAIDSIKEDKDQTGFLEVKTTLIKNMKDCLKTVTPDKDQCLVAENYMNCIKPKTFPIFVLVKE